MSIKIGEPEYEEDGGFITTEIEYSKGNPDCEHDYLESKLLFTKRCQKCGKTQST